MHLDLLLTKG